ncbi:MAG: TonB-dependent receptor [Acidobacteriota bacterium]|nr:TonB-dependent receptor [Acidobacteriota bacterium]
MRILFSLFLICFLTIGVLAQQKGATILGQLTDDGKVLANTQVKLVPNNALAQGETYATTTDGEGNYKFENVADGSYQIAFTSSTNKQVLQKVYYIKKGKDVTAETISGNVNQRLFGEVSVIASGTKQTNEEVSKSVDTIENIEIRERNEFSLIDSLRTIPGFRIQQLGGFGRTANIKSRGLRNQDTAVLIDGIRFRDASAITGDASAFLSDFTFAADNRVEVLRGAGSSLYGTNAVGGTIDFQTPRPQSGFHGGFLGEGGGLGFKRLRGNVSDGTRDGKFAFNLGVGRTIFSKGIDGDDAARNTNFQLRVEYNPFSKTNISARFYISDASVKLNSSPDTFGTLPATNATIIRAVPLSSNFLKRFENGQTVSNFGGATFIPDANDPDNFQKSQFFDGQFVLTQIINNKLVFQGYYQGLRTRRKNDNGILGTGFQSPSTSIFTGLINTANGHFNYSPNASNLITVGYEFEREKFGNDGFAPSPTSVFSTRAHQQSNTFYSQDQLDFFKRRLQISGGFRAQLFNLKNPKSSGANPPYQNITLENPPTAYTFDGSASYFFEKTGTKIRTHAGNGYRVPSLFERFGSFYATFLTPNRFVGLGDPNLKPERSIGFDGGVDQIFMRNRVKLSAVYFYTRLIDTIGFGNSVANIGTTRRDFGGYLNTKGGVSRGAEFSAQIKATDSTDVFASYTYTNSDQRAPQVTGTQILQTLGVPKNQFTLVATQRIGKRFSVNFDFLATSDYLAPIFDSNNFTFQTYVYQFNGNRRGDLTARYEFPTFNEKLRFTAFGTVENIFDYDYFENGFRTTGRMARGGLGLNF